MRTLWQLTRFVAATARFLLRGGVLLVVLAMLALNVATLAFAPLSAAAGALLARAGITTVAGGLEARVASADRHVDELTGELGAARRRIAAQADDLAAAERRIAAQADELAALRHVRYRGQTRTLREAVAETTDRIARRTATAAARNVAAVPAETLPFFGIAVILGATAWELSDACALMQDVHELNVAFDPSLANDPAKHEACGLEMPTATEVWQRIGADPAGALVEQPAEYGDLPAFQEPGWWDWALSRIPTTVSPDAVPPEE